MRTFDLAPLYRATVGFDQMADLMDRALANDISQSSYPPYNIELTGDDRYRITMAVAGFSADEIEIETSGHAQRLGNGFDAELVAGWSDETDFTGPDAVVHAVLVATLILSRCYG